ncbi:hypothetical protein B0T21DRAFT_95833 [Apiosordaria backusii]|uniref:Uncharacterized protein n=1 Tax=Apiosordaria backusii TaxID=314023 RepID=A0AA40ET14_9PEZI|nr:hypothetical protein B0T21DRAFT_95833 [Apiosordaria backusii]
MTHPCSYPMSIQVGGGGGVATKYESYRSWERGRCGAHVPGLGPDPGVLLYRSSRTCLEGQILRHTCSGSDNGEGVGTRVVEYLR